MLGENSRYPSYFDWISDIELAQDDLAWAKAQVLKLKAPRLTIHEELCQRLKAKNIQPPSRTVFYRWAARVCQPATKPFDVFLRQPEFLDLLRPETRALAVAALRAMIEDLERPLGPLFNGEIEDDLD